MLYVKVMEGGYDPCFARDVREQVRRGRLGGNFHRGAKFRSGWPRYIRVRPPPARQSRGHAHPPLCMRVGGVRAHWRGTTGRRPIALAARRGAGALGARCRSGIGLCMKGGTGTRAKAGRSQGKAIGCSPARRVPAWSHEASECSAVRGGGYGSCGGVLRMCVCVRWGGGGATYERSYKPLPLGG